MKHYKTYKLKIIAATLSFIFFAAVLAALSIVDAMRVQKSQISEIMRDYSRETKAIFDYNMNSLFLQLENYAEIVSVYDDIKSPEALELLSGISKKNGFYKLCVVQKGGYAYSEDESVYDFSGNTYVFKALEGENTVSQLTTREEFDRNVVICSCPIYKDGKVIGALSALLDSAKISELSDFDLYDSRSVYIIDGRGTILNSSLLQQKHGNYFTALSGFELGKGYTVNDLESSLLGHVDSMIEYHDGSDSMYDYYLPLAYNNWFVVTSFPKEFIEDEYNYYIFSLLALIIKIFVISIPYMVFISYNKKCYYDENRIRDEELSFMTQNTADYIFEINPSTFEIRFNSNFTQRYGFDPESISVSDGEIINDRIYKDDADAVRNFFEEIKKGTKTNEVTFRFRTGLNNYECCRAFSYSITNRRGKLLKVIGRIATDEEEVLCVARIEETSRRDGLTGFSNKLGTKALIDEYAANRDGESGCLLLLEISEYEKLFGNGDSELADKIIAEAAQNIQKLFRSSDIVGRTEKNEFAVMMKKVASIELITEKALEINRIFNAAAASAGLSQGLTLYIGISHYPEDADDFTGLYKKSQRAMKKAEEEKQTLWFFSPEDDYSKLGI